MAHPQLISLGSINMDIQVRADRWPESGETLLATAFLMTCGGKAANVAVLNRRLGVETLLLGQVGDDILGNDILRQLKEAGIDLDHVRQVPDTATAVSTIVVKPDGEKTIIVAANANLSWDKARDAPRIAELIAAAPDGSVLVADLEVPVAIVKVAIQAAHERSLPVVLDPSPADRFTDDLCQRIDLILDAEGDSANNYKLAKQPDVLMLFYLFTDEELESLVQSLGYDLGTLARKDTIEYYLNRNTGGSTLSRVVQAEVFAGTDRSRSLQCVQEALQSDVDDIQGGSTATGIHIGAMGGTIEIIERRYTGIDARGDALRFNPALPDELQRLSMRLYYRNCRLDVTLTHRRLRIATSSVPAETITIALRDQRQELTPETPIDWEW